MQQPFIVTVTLNPAIDVSGETERLVPGPKLRCRSERRDPGGGGINVARVLKRLGADSIAVFPVGGDTGARLEKLVRSEGVCSAAIPTGGETRENITVFEATTGSQYRFVFPGPHLSTWDIRKCCDAALISATPHCWMVASGSLPPGSPPDTYAVLARKAAGAGVLFALDTSGEALRNTISDSVHLLKLNEAELGSLSDATLRDTDDCIAAAKTLLARGPKMIAVTRAQRGALLISDNFILGAEAPPVVPASTVGAGDSFLAALIWELARANHPDEALRSAVAAGCAALMAPGTDLSRAEAIWHLRPHVKVKPLHGEQTFVMPTHHAPVEHTI